ncbi:alpha/beta fold hydrolase [Acanthopleuribacter pedis]|uniref:Alpha/beta hydrolase n=1 Tax=Acanthopleuribacter pedis TaxID=442870 RepID=A0A8J7QDY2_9BACT|nr:alpha/beta hydrolase [Acanthopleuribacter pedis]MBO1322797.1 alpha/beta hydrolase [Acanthopleuribacter pedis]
MAFETLNGLRIHTQVLGRQEGPVRVVFLHGLVMDNLSSWYFTFANPVAQDHKVLLYDMRGHGRSERPASGYRLDDFVAELAALLEHHAGDSPVTLVGNSFGGLLALAYALAYPNRTAGVCLIEAHANVQGWGDEMAATLLQQGDQARATVATHFENWLGRHSERKKNRLAENAKQLIYETSLVADLQATPELDARALTRLPQPVLALYGETSDIRARGEALAAQLPNAELHIFSDCSHSIMWEATDKVRTALTEWLSHTTQEV